LLVSWLPFLVLFDVFIFLMLHLQSANSPQQRAQDEQKRQNEALEKILASHEERLQKIEEDRRGSISN
jgi:hypothetical protein